MYFSLMGIMNLFLTLWYFSFLPRLIILSPIQAEISESCDYLHPSPKNVFLDLIFVKENLI